MNNIKVIFDKASKQTRGQICNLQHDITSLQWNRFPGSKISYGSGGEDFYIENLDIEEAEIIALLFNRFGVTDKIEFHHDKLGEHGNIMDSLSPRRESQKTQQCLIVTLSAR